MSHHDAPHENHDGPMSHHDVPHHHDGPNDFTCPEKAEKMCTQECRPIGVWNKDEKTCRLPVGPAGPASCYDLVVNNLCDIPPS